MGGGVGGFGVFLTLLEKSEFPARNPHCSEQSLHHQVLEGNLSLWLYHVSYENKKKMLVTQKQSQTSFAIASA